MEGVCFARVGGVYARAGHPLHDARAEGALPRRGGVRPREEQLRARSRQADDGQEGYDHPPPAAARQRDHAGRGQRSPSGLFPAGRERQVRAHGADLHAAALGRREQALRADPGFRRGVHRERVRVHEPPLHLRHGGCGPAFPPPVRRDLPLRLLRGEGPAGVMPRMWINCR